MGAGGLPGGSDLQAQSAVGGELEEAGTLKTDFLPGLQRTCRHFCLCEPLPTYKILGITLSVFIKYVILQVLL